MGSELYWDLDCAYEKEKKKVGVFFFIFSLIWMGVLQMEDPIMQEGEEEKGTELEDIFFEGIAFCYKQL